MPIFGELKGYELWRWVELKARLLQECYKNQQNEAVIREFETAVRNEINARIKEN